MAFKAHSSAQNVQSDSLACAKDLPFRRSEFWHKSQIGLPSSPKLKCKLQSQCIGSKYLIGKGYYSLHYNVRIERQCLEFKFYFKFLTF